MSHTHTCQSHGRQVAPYAGQAAARNARRRTDPTRTKTPRKRFAGHLRQRFNAIKFHIRRGVVDRDAFNLTGGPSGADIRRLAGNVPTDDDVTPGVGGFDYPTSAAAVDAFADWLDDALQREVLEKYSGDTYVSQGYARGIKHADAQVRAETATDPPDHSATATIRGPVHRDKLALIHNRAYQELEGVTSATAQEMRRELAEGLGQGLGPRELARDLNDRVERVGKTRATVLARTEVVRAHAEATVNRYEELLGDDVTVTPKAELLVSGDRRTCEQCLALEGTEFTLKEARGLIPLHPQCRCALTIASS